MKEYQVGKYTVKEHENGHKYWYVGKELHREDGPAVEYGNGNRYWYQHGVYHRVDGPAIRYKNGFQAWYLEGKEYSKEQFDAEIKRRDAA